MDSWLLAFFQIEFTLAPALTGNPTRLDRPFTMWHRVLARLQREMEQAAALLEFEKAATLRDRLKQVRQQIDDEEWKSARKSKLKRR